MLDLFDQCELNKADAIYTKFCKENDEYYGERKKLINKLYENHKEFLDSDFPEKLKVDFYGALWELICANFFLVPQKK